MTLKITVWGVFSASLKGPGTQIWLKTIFCMNFYCFMYDLSVALISALALLKYTSLRLPVVL